MDPTSHPSAVPSSLEASSTTQITLKGRGSQNVWVPRGKGCWAPFQRLLRYKPKQTPPKLRSWNECVIVKSGRRNNLAPENKAALRKGLSFPRVLFTWLVKFWDKPDKPLPPASEKYHSIQRVVHRNTGFSPYLKSLYKLCSRGHKICTCFNKKSKSDLWKKVEFSRRSSM